MATIYGHHCDLALFREVYREIADEITKARGSSRRDGTVKPSPDSEPFRSCLAAEFHRQFWKPTNPRVALLAESHVYTDRIDLACSVATDSLPLDMRGTSSQFVRLIYCLAYGDSSLVRGRLDQANDGTPQYWKLFDLCAGTTQTPVGSLARKLSVLQALKARGIWLADASIHACMNPRFPVTDPRRHLAKCSRGLYETVLGHSWRYVRTTVEAFPEIWIIGSGVRNALSDPILNSSKWVYQPNGARTKEQRSEYARQMQGLMNSINAMCPPPPQSLIGSEL